MNLVRRAAQGVAAVSHSVRNDFRATQNLDLYALQVAALGASVWGYFTEPVAGIALSALVVWIAELLRTRHAKRDLSTALESMSDLIAATRSEVHELTRRLSDPSLDDFRRQLAADSNAPATPRRQRVQR